MRLIEQTAASARFEDQQDVGWTIAFACAVFALWALRVALRDRKKNGLTPAHFAGVITLVAGGVAALGLGTTHTIVTLDRAKAEARVVERSALGLTSRDDTMTLAPPPEVKIQLDPHFANRGRAWERVSLVRGGQELPLTDYSEQFDEAALIASTLTAWLHR